MKGIVAVLTVGAAILASQVSYAKTQDFAHSGVWDAFGGTDDQGNEVCGVSTHLNDGSDFLIKRYENDSNYVVQAYNSNWSLSFARADVSLTMGNNTPWTANAAVLRSTHGLEFTVPLLKTIDFLDEFSSSDSMVYVMGTNKVRWSMSLDGSDVVAKSFQDCIKQMSN
jgi:hypothetical protein